MKTRNSALYALGLAAAITFGASVSADAQARPTRPRARPTTRIPVRKDVPPPPKTDTVIVTRVDTVTVRRVDTLTGPTVMRYDTVTRMVYPPLQRLPGLFFGIGAGSTIPMNNIRALVKDSWGVQGQVGYFPMNSPLGIRLDGTYGQMHARETDCPTCSNAKLWTVGGDLILRMPLDRTSKLNPVLYVFGGGGWANFSDVDPRYTAFLRTNSEPLWKSEGNWYYDVGPGVDFNVGGLHFYAEGKYLTIMTDRKNVHAFPVYGGLKFY
jgi:Outer membrane protein beta-barrel domain